MKPITPGGVWDHVFVDDRDEQLECLPSGTRLPAYARNDLRRPARALTPKEARIVNAIGLPKPTRKGR